MRILCFGDSNTWGFKPDASGRFEKRWPILLQQRLPNDTIIEEGLNGRTFNTDEAGRDGINGYSYFIPCLDSHDPLDVVIIALGLNDVKMPYGHSAEDIQKQCNEFISVVKTRPNSIPGKNRKCILIAPNLASEDCSWVEFEGVNDKVTKLFELYSELDVDGVVDARDLAVGDDGVHMTQESHEELAKRVEKVIRQHKS